MQIIHDPAAVQAQALRWKREGLRIGCVPTMGYLHEGHLSLVRLARPASDKLVVTLFVNPTQFGPSEDFTRYPRNAGRDEALCREEGVDVLFAPEPGTMYKPDASVTVAETRLTRAYEGAKRPGHFAGVLTVVAKLFNLVLPDVAAFGRKDAQQLAVLRRMVRDLNFPVTIVPGETVREPDGLALSSRNVYLNPEQRAQAVGLHRALTLARELVERGERDGETVRETMRRELSRAPLAVPDYLDVVDEESFEPVNRVDRASLALLAVGFGQTRLLDNMLLEPGPLS